MGFPGGSDGKESACSVGGLGSIPQSGRSPGGRNGNLLQYTCLENSMDLWAWQATVHGVAKSRTRLSDLTNWLILSRPFQSPPLPSSRGSLVSLCSLPLEQYHPHMQGCWCFSHLSWLHLVAHPVCHFTQTNRVTADSTVIFYQSWTNQLLLTGF